MSSTLRNVSQLSPPTAAEKIVTPFKAIPTASVVHCTVAGDDVMLTPPTIEYVTSTPKDERSTGDAGSSKE
jgi:hypothetical protein